jgi:hypothetical protein
MTGMCIKISLRVDFCGLNSFACMVKLCEFCIIISSLNRYKLNVHYH